ncbi:uncharacterized protein LOC132549471 [Ylistrum balloti]|uniref:uncharacterized protein LOC132549471 n=1 Tax=Ylistrum balloti TaxID=509963 RepID=UPI002905DCB9|nr:uncharacterized protein LOC132549471 [Ylistrum balloti]
MVDNEMLPLLANESCVEDIVPFIDDINECEQRVAMVQERALPSGKEYHLFISFSNEDKPYALSLKNALEGRGLKCMVADQGFIAGVPIMRNIEVFIEKSHKLLLLVSQHFLQSSYCDWEVEIAHLYAADNRRKDFMIVVRLDESKMPRKLGYMTYINGVDMDIDEVGRKVDEAFNNHVTNIRQIGRNGQEILRKKPYEASQKLCCSSSSQFDDLFESERDLIEPSSIRKSAELYRSLILCANDHTLFKRYGLFTFGRKALCFHFLLLSGIIALFSSFYLLGTTLAGTAFTLNMLALSSFGFAVLTISLHGLTVFILFRQRIQSIDTSTKEKLQCHIMTSSVPRSTNSSETTSTKNNAAPNSGVHEHNHQSSDERGIYERSGMC